MFTVDLSQDGVTALHVACHEGHDQVVELLLQAGASVDQKAEVRWEISQAYIYCKVVALHTFSYLGTLLHQKLGGGVYFNTIKSGY